MDKKKRKVIWVDISEDDYNAADHSNIDYVTAMGSMHVIDSNGKVIDHVSFFELNYVPFLRPLQIETYVHQQLLMLHRDNKINFLKIIKVNTDILSISVLTSIK